MQLQFTRLKDSHLKLEYVRLLAQPNQKDYTSKKLRLLMENKSLIMLQFASEDEIPSEHVIRNEINVILVKTNKDYKQYQNDCEQAQEILVDIEENVQNELFQLQQNII